MEFIDYTNDPRAVLIHFNDKHDSNGRFAKKSGSISSSIKNRGKASFIGDKDLDIPDGEKKMAGMWASEAFKEYTGWKPSEVSSWFNLVGNNGTIASDAKKRFINGMKSAAYDCADFYLNESSAYKAYRTDEYRSEKDYLQGSARLYNSVYANMLDEFKDQPFALAYLESDVGKNQIANSVGRALYYAWYEQQSEKEPINKLAKQARLKTVSTSSESKGVKKREKITLADVKKANPNLPAAALNEMYKGLTAAKKDSGIRGVSKLPENKEVKHSDAYSKYFGEVLAHFNPNHDPKTGQFTKNKSGGSAKSDSLPFGQNKYVDADGKLTEAGIARLLADKQRNDQKKKDDQVKGEEEEVLRKLADPRRWVNEDLSNLEKEIKQLSDMTKSMQEYENKKITSMPKVRKQKLDLSNMTDAELNERINRYTLEKRYQDIFNPEVSPEVSKGKQWLMNTLKIAGTALSVGASAVAIAKTINDMKIAKVTNLGLTGGTVSHSIFVEDEHPRDKNGRFKRAEKSGTTTISDMYTSVNEAGKARLQNKKISEYAERQKNDANRRASTQAGLNSPRAYVEREFHPGEVPYMEQVKRVLQKYSQDRISLKQATQIISHKTKQRVNAFLNRKLGLNLNTD